MYKDTRINYGNTYAYIGKSAKVRVYYMYQCESEENLFVVFTVQFCINIFFTQVSFVYMKEIHYSWFMKQSLFKINSLSKQLLRFDASYAILKYCIGEHTSLKVSNEKRVVSVSHA